MATKKKTPKKLKKFTVKYTAILMVEAKSINEAYAAADTALIDMVEGDEMAIEEIFGIEMIEDKIHDVTTINCEDGTRVCSVEDIDDEYEDIDDDDEDEDIEDEDLDDDDEDGDDEDSEEDDGDEDEK